MLADVSRRASLAAATVYEHCTHQQQQHSTAVEDLAAAAAAVVSDQCQLFHMLALLLIDAIVFGRQ